MTDPSNHSDTESRTRRAFVAFVASSFATSLALFAPFADAAEADAPELAPRSFVVALNPLGVAMGRYSATLDYAPVPHLGLTLTPYMVRNLGKDGASFGTEIGARWYSSRSGPFGFFVGPSILAQSGNDGIIFPDYGRLALGVTLDAGGQVRIGDRFVFGAGAGGGYLLSGSFKQEVRVFPRLLLSLGVAF